MAVNKSLNRILKRMWNLDDKLSSGKVLNKEEKIFYNKNLKIIKKYYLKNGLYWEKNKIIK